MLGDFDDRHGYGLPKNIADILIKMPKKPIASKDEIDVGSDTAFLRSESGIDFCLENSTLFLVEYASEMGGLVAFTYLTPLTEITNEYFKTLDANADLTPLKERAQARRTKHQIILAEHERLAQGAMQRARRILTYKPIPEFEKFKSDGKRFIRPGKPDYNTSQLQILAHVIEKGDLLHPVADIISRWKTACNNKTSAQLLSELPSELHVPQILNTKKSAAPSGKTLDFKSILAAMLKQDKPRKSPARLKASANAAEILGAETEVDKDFETEPVETTTDVPEFTDEEKELRKLISTILEQKNTPQQTTKVKNIRQGIAKGRQSEHAPVSLNHDHER